VKFVFHFAIKGTFRIKEPQLHPVTIDLTPLIMEIEMMHCNIFPIRTL
jgi:hypothetical protein